MKVSQSFRYHEAHQISEPDMKVLKPEKGDFTLPPTKAKKYSCIMQRLEMITNILGYTGTIEGG